MCGEGAAVREGEGCEGGGGEGRDGDGVDEEEGEGVVWVGGEVFGGRGGKEGPYVVADCGTDVVVVRRLAGVQRLTRHSNSSAIFYWASQKEQRSDGPLSSKPQAHPQC